MILIGTPTPCLGMLERARLAKDHCRRCENGSAEEYGFLEMTTWNKRKEKGRS